MLFDFGTFTNQTVSICYIKNYAIKLKFCTSAAYCYVTLKPESQNNDVRCEYPCGAPSPLLLQIPIDIKPN